MKIWKLIHEYDKEEINRELLLIKLTSYFGWLKYCDSKNLLHKIYLKTGIWYSNWNGELVPYYKFRGKKIYVVHVEPRKKYYYIQFVYRGIPYLIKSKNYKLFCYLSTCYPILLHLK